MTEVEWPAAEEQPVDMRLVLPVEVMNELAAGIAKVLEVAKRRDSDPAELVALYVAPELAARDAQLADARLQVAQAGVALAESMAASIQVAGRHVWLREVAERRHGSAQRLRTELWSALPEAEQFRSLTRQGCAAGVHAPWYAPSGGRHWRCPWCLIPTKVGEHLARLAEALGIEAAEDDVDMYVAVAELQAEVDRLRDAIASQPGYAEQHRDCVTIGGGYCVDVHAEDDLEDEGDGQEIPPSVVCSVVGASEPECPAHGPHPHARLKCLDCPQCVDGQVGDEDDHVVIVDGVS
jgi:hypothetical protein